MHSFPALALSSQELLSIRSSLLALLSFPPVTRRAAVALPTTFLLIAIDPALSNVHPPSWWDRHLFGMYFSSGTSRFRVAHSGALTVSYFDIKLATSKNTACRASSSLARCSILTARGSSPSILKLKSDYLDPEATSKHTFTLQIKEFIWLCFDERKLKAPRPW